MKVVDYIAGRRIVELNAHERRTWGCGFWIVENVGDDPHGPYSTGAILATAQTLEEAIELAGELY